MALQLSSFPPESDLFIALLVALAVAWPLLRRSDLVLLLLGGTLFWQSSNSVSADRIAARFEGDSLLTTVRIVEFPALRQSGASFVAEPVDDARVPQRIRLTWQEPPVEPQIGDVWQLELRLRRPRGNANPGSMDVEAWLQRTRIGATGYVVASRHSQLRDSRTHTGLSRIRAEFVGFVDRRLGESDASAVILAIAIGSRHRISSEQWDRYAASGISHLMAISGLHVGLAAVSAYWLAIALLASMQYRRPQLVALLLALLIAIAYAALSGFAVPARRAVLMLALVSVAAVMRREVDGFRVIALAVLLIVAVEPLSTMQPGFKLSFAAVLVLSWWVRRLRRASRRWATLISAQFALFFALLPLTVLLFDRVSLVAPLVNLIAVPVFSLVTVPAALLSVVCPDVAAGFFLDVAVASVIGVDQLAEIATKPSSASATTALLSGLGLLLLLIPLCWLLPRGWPLRPVAVLGVAAIVCWRPAPPDAGCVNLSAIDVGDGLAIAVRGADHTLLYDTGASWRDEDSVAKSVILPWLRATGVSRIDELIVSHADNDHAGGVEDLLTDIAVTSVRSGEPLPGIATRRCHKGMTWRWPDATFLVLHPDDRALTGNDASCVLLVSIGEYRLLLTGDIEANTETALVRARQLPTVDIVTVPHHGSLTSSLPAFVRALEPRIAIVSARADNRWGFPRPEVVARWRAVGAQVLNTADSGAISIRVCKDSGIDTPKEWRNQRRRIWHDPDS